MNKNRAWQRMLSGRRLDLLDPTPLDIEVEDIAHGLSSLPGGMGKQMEIFHTVLRNIRC